MKTLRSLTDGEIRLARSLFGDSIDYARVRISPDKYIPLQQKGTGVVGRDGNIYMNIDNLPVDLSTARIGLQRGFIHEMTHVWQVQNGIFDPVKEFTKLLLKHRFNYGAAYKFRLEEKKDLLDYNMEQQATIIEAYFLGWSRYNPLYNQVLEKFFKNPSYARR